MAGLSRTTSQPAAAAPAGGFSLGANGSFQLGPTQPLGTGPTVSAGGLSPFSIFNGQGQVDPALAALVLQNNNQALSASEFNANESDKRTALNALLGATGNLSANGSGGVTAPVVTDPTVGMPAGGYDATAETNAYARAKDASAEALQGAMKGLNNTLSARGLTGSGLQAKGAEQLYENAEENIANTGNQLASTEAGQAFTSGENAKARGVDVAKTNAANNLAAQTTNQQTATQRLSSLLSTFGSLY